MGFEFGGFHTAGGGRGGALVAKARPTLTNGRVVRTLPSLRAERSSDGGTALA